MTAPKIPPPITKHVPVWEQVLRRLAQGEDQSELLSGPLLDLLVRLVSTNQSIERIVSRVPKLVEGITPQGIIAFFDTKKSDRLQIVSSNVGRQSEQEMLRKLSTLAQTEQSGLDPLTNAVAVGGKIYPYLYSGLCSKTDQRQLRLIIALPTKFTAGQLRTIRLVLSVLSLRYAAIATREKLVQEGERFNTIIQHLSEGMMILDRQLRVQVWNRPLQHLTGYAPSTAVGKPYQEVFLRVDHPTWLEELVAEYQGQPYHNLFSCELQIQTRTRQNKWLSVSGSFLRDGTKNTIEQIIIIIRDISYNKELEERKSEFISIATHELRTPITAISGYLSLIHKNVDNFSEKQRLYLDRATQASQRLVRLAEDLLRVVQLEENRTQFNQRPTDPSRLLEKVVADFSPKANAKNLTLQFRALGADCLILVDSDRFSQACANLIDNALKYTHRGGVNVMLSQSANKNTDKEVVIEISDTGDGITSKELPLVFDRFRRGRSAKHSRESGAGLGLYIVKSFIEKQGGKVTVKSKLNQGTVFRITFPAVERKNKGG